MPSGEVCESAGITEIPQALQAMEDAGTNKNAKAEEVNAVTGLSYISTAESDTLFRVPAEVTSKSKIDDIRHAHLEFVRCSILGASTSRQQQSAVLSVVCQTTASPAVTTCGKDRHEHEGHSAAGCTSTAPRCTTGAGELAAEAADGSVTVTF
jgi:hypothetical protein